MSDRIPPRPPNTESPSNVTGNEYATFSYDWAVPGSGPSGLAPNAVSIQGFEDLPGPSPGERSTNAKVAIPRSAQTVAWTSTGRTSRACENCREQKAKCSGHHPTCNRCKDAGIRCSYGDRKREKMIKQLDSLKAQIQSYEALLRELYPRLDSPSAQYVDQALSGQLVRGTPSSPAAHFDQNTDQQGFDLPSGIHHPLAAIDHTEEDFNRDEKQALGFVGEHSEMTWLYRLKRDLDKDHLTPIGEILDRPSISSLNYFHEGMPNPNLDAVDVLERPAHPSADKLVDTYFEIFHPAFPIIGKGIFLSQYRSFYSNPSLRPGRRWMAILNLVFALAAKHLLLAHNESMEEDDIGSPNTYFARAWRLSLGNMALLAHPNLQQVQVEGLASFFLLATGQVNRSWRMIGIAIRSAVAMGLNLRSESGDISHVSKETRYRVWWALFMLDTLLCVMIGRPPSTGTHFCTTPLPVPFIEEDFGDDDVKQIIMDYNTRQSLLRSLLSQADFLSEISDPFKDLPPSHSFGSGKGKQSTLGSQYSIKNPTPNISLYFLCGVDLAFLMRKAVETLYAPGATRRSWLEMENAMNTFNNSADVWFSRLPLEYRFTRLDADQPFVAQRTGLAFRFYATKIVITQPCLRRLAYQTSGSTPPGHLCHNLAMTCVQAARDMLSMFTDETDIYLLYRTSPWWCILHHTMQSTTIILVELFTRTSPGTIEAAGLAEDVQKATRWLREMATRDASSQRAWSVCMELLSQHGLKFALYVD